MEEPTVQKPARNWLRWSLIGLVVLVVIAIPVGTFFAGRQTASSDSSGTPAAETSTSQYNYDILNQIWNILHREYAKQDNLDQQTLYEAAINGALNVLNDSGTYYVDPETFKVSTSTTLSGGFDGIGATISQQGTDIVIVKPIDNTPAAEAGLVSGDVITAVNGESIQGWTVEKAVLAIRGPSGSQVTITIRHSDGESQDYTLTRSHVEVDSVTMIPPGGILRDENDAQVNDLAYIHIDEFTPRTAQEMEDALNQVQDSGAKGLIIDVRNNLGGSLQAVISTCDLLLDSGTIVTQREANGQETSYVAKPDALVPGLPIVLLQNQYSASASEILSAALKENGRATVVGQTSFGKGTVNTAQQLSDGGALFVTIAEWLTPTGALIDKVGIRPDIEVIPSDDDLSARRDVQLFKAIDVLRGQAQSPAPSGTTSATDSTPTPVTSAATPSTEPTVTQGSSDETPTPEPTATPGSSSVAPASSAPGLIVMVPTAPSPETTVSDT